MSLRRWVGSPAARALFWAAGAFALVMAVLPHPPLLPGDPSDKVQHVVAFVSLAALGQLAYPALQRLRLLFALGLFGALIEVLQTTPGLNRDGNVLDWVVDSLAAGLTLWLIGRAGGTRANEAAAQSSQLREKT